MAWFKGREPKRARRGARRSSYTPAEGRGGDDDDDGGRRVLDDVGPRTERLRRHLALSTRIGTVRSLHHNLERSAELRRWCAVVHRQWSVDDGCPPADFPKRKPRAHLHGYIESAGQV